MTYNPVQFTDAEVDAYRLSDLIEAQRRICPAVLSYTMRGYTVVGDEVGQHEVDISHHGSPIWERTPGNACMTLNLKRALLQDIARHTEQQARREAAHCLVAKFVRG